MLDGLHTRLSASAVDTYERCGLQFKLERDWRLSDKPAAAMQYGAAIHRVLKTYFDSVNLGRPKTDDELIDLFRLDLVGAKIQEAYQHELYEKQGIEQLRDFLAAARTLPAPQVLHTEQSFEIRVGETAVAGRIDRIDRRPDGSVAIVDYKTGKARDQEDADESLQLSLYAIAAREKWGYTVGALIFHNLAGECSRSLTTRTEVATARCPRAAWRPRPRESPTASSKRSPGSTAISARIAVCVRRKRSAFRIAWRALPGGRISRTRPK